MDAKTEVLRRHCAEVGRDPDEVAVTVLDLPVVGRDREDVWAARRAAAGPDRRGDVRPASPRGHRRPSTAPATAAGRPRVTTVFVALPDLDRPEDLLDVAAMLP